MSVLITGGTGYLGQALARALLARGEQHVRIYSRGEHAQAAMREAFGGERLRFLVGDVRDLARLTRAMHQVDVVIHAAALKRIEVGHYNPTEMVRTNIGGAMNVIDAAVSAGARRVIAVSTDKAFQPVSPYGASKALAEWLFLNANAERPNGPRFAVVRYGNVAGSTGSVIPRWRELLRSQDRVPITDPDCTRFWMTIAEAVDLVLGTAERMTGGELVIPDLPAYRLGDLASAMNAQAVVCGLPAWEKRHEALGEGRTSDAARRMSVEELRVRLAGV